MRTFRLVARATVSVFTLVDAETLDDAIAAAKTRPFEPPVERGTYPDYDYWSHWYKEDAANETIGEIREDAT